MRIRTRQVAAGRQGTLETIRAIFDAIVRAQIDPAIVKFTRKAIGNTPAKNERVLIRKIVDAWLERVSILEDPVRHEFVQDPAVTLREGRGDCDDLAAAVGASIEHVGIPVELVLSSNSPRKSEEFSHVWLRAFLRSEDVWLPVDPRAIAELDFKIGQELPRSGLTAIESFQFNEDRNVIESGESLRQRKVGDVNFGRRLRRIRETPGLGPKPLNVDTSFPPRIPQGGSPFQVSRRRPIVERFRDAQRTPIPSRVPSTLPARPTINRPGNLIKTEISRQTGFKDPSKRPPQRPDLQTRLRTLDEIVPGRLARRERFVRPSLQIRLRDVIKREETRSERAPDPRAIATRDELEKFRRQASIVGRRARRRFRGLGTTADEELTRQVLQESRDTACRRPGVGDAFPFIEATRTEGSAFASAGDITTRETITETVTDTEIEEEETDDAAERLVKRAGPAIAVLTVLFLGTGIFKNLGS